MNNRLFILYNVGTMSNALEIAKKFTDEQYATYSQVGRALHMFTFDDYWEQITSYRKAHQVTLPFGKIKDKNFTFTLTEPIKLKIENFEKKINAFMVMARNVSYSYPKEARNALLMPLLKQIAALENSNMNELSIKVLLSGIYNDSDNNRNVVVNYLQSLDYYLDKTPDLANDEFLAGAYSRVLGQEELTAFYRYNDFDGKVARLRYVLNADYPYAPSDMIDTLMEDFLTWLTHDEKLPSFAHSVIAAFYLDYVKPFDERNAPMAALLAKDAYANETGDSAAFYLPLENLLDDSFKRGEAYRETKIRSDLTYLVFEAMGRLSPMIDKFTEELKKLRISPIKEDFSQLAPEEEEIAARMETAIEQPLPEPTQLSLPEETEETPIKEISPEPIPSAPLEVAKPQPTPVVEKPTPAPVPVISSLSSQENAGASIEVGLETLSKTEVKDYIRYLLETNPNLNKKQASFLATHCTVGRYYTIQQFKEHAKCVYETARTSMDKLAAEGYYQKLQFKNKFVYSPVTKGKKQ